MQPRVSQPPGGNRLISALTYVENGLKPSVHIVDVRPSLGVLIPTLFSEPPKSRDESEGFATGWFMRSVSPRHQYNDLHVYRMREWDFPCKHLSDMR